MSSNNKKNHRYLWVTTKELWIKFNNKLTRSNSVKDKLDELVKEYINKGD